MILLNAQGVYDTLIYITFSIIILLLGTITSLIVYIWSSRRKVLDERVDAIEHRVEKIEKVKPKVERIDKLEEKADRIDNLELRLDRIERRS